jgi:23S rRNA (adenine2030-N6)-methyltransferase
LLSYRHAYHAGNHADVLKHVVLVALLDYLTIKPKPIAYVDTHAGAGSYDLTAPPAAMHREFERGIGRLWSADPPPATLERYVGLVRRLNPAGTLRRYPGSPWLARQVLRPTDTATLCELHPADHNALDDLFAAGPRRVRVQHGDGLAALRALLPPPSRRGLVLIDPAYEQASEYQGVLAALAAGLRQFATGTFAVWYPQIARTEAAELPAKLCELGGSRWLDARLTVRASDTGGLFGSGMFVINPPFVLHDMLEEALPALVALLGESPDARFELATAPL